MCGETLPFRMLFTFHLAITLLLISAPLLFLPPKPVGSSDFALRSENLPTISRFFFNLRSLQPMFIFSQQSSYGCSL